MAPLHDTVSIQPPRSSRSRSDNHLHDGLQLYVRLLFTLSCLLVVSGCGAEPSSTSSAPPTDSATTATQDHEAIQQQTFTDDTGRTVDVGPSVTRIVPLAPNLTEVVYAAGAGHKLVAVTTADDYPPAVDSLPRVSTLPVDYEAITAHEPDLVVATTQVNATRAAETFESLDIPVYFFSFPTVQSIFDGIRRMGVLAGTPRAAADSAEALETAFRRIQDLAPTARRPRVLVLAGSDVLYSFGAESYIHTLIDAAGGTSITRDLDASAPTLSEEYVLEARPDVIVGAFGTDAPAETLLKHHPSFDILPAVRNDRIYSIPASLLFRPGPRIVDGTQRLAEQLHPNRFRAETQQASVSSR